MKTIVTILLLVPFGTHLWAQDSAALKSYDLLPVITYSPATALNLGIMGFRYFDFSKEEKPVQNSFINAAAIYTTRNQLFIESGYQFFFPNQDRMTGWTYFFDAPDRNYGLGNNADLLIVEGPEQDTVNYLNVDVTRIGFIGNYQKEFRPNYFLGPMVQMENVISYDTVPGSFQIINGETQLHQLQNRLEGWRVALGLSFTIDTRDRVINPRRGHLINLSQLIYSQAFGSDYEYSATRMEVIGYINPTSNHTIAFRIIQDWKHTLGDKEAIPLYGLSRPDSRGYIRGTFQDHHAQQIDLEYRLPFWRDHALDDPNFRFWKGLGMVFFVSGQQAYGETDSYQLSNTNLAVGSGLRILLNKKNQLNLRIDYAIGLLENSNGVDGRQASFTFNLSEAF